MKKQLISTLLIISTGYNLNAAQGIEIIDDWELQGDLKIGYVKYDYNNPPSLTSTGRIDSHGVYMAPKISLITPTYKNIFAKTTITGVTDFGINDPDYETRNYIFDNTDKTSFALLQEFFISYSDKSNNLTIGRQEIVTPLVEADDYYFVANSFDAINYINTSIENFSFHLGYFYQMAGVWDSGANGEEFHSMSDSSFVDSRDKTNANDSGIIYGAVEYQDENHKLKLWDYYTSDLYNIFLADYKFSNKIDSFNYSTSLQFVNYKDVGELESNSFTEIDYSIISAKLDTSFNNGIDANIALTKFTDGVGLGATLGAWGGFPSYTYGFAHSYFIMGTLRDANIFKFQVGYNLEKLGLNNLRVDYRCNYYDLNSKYSKNSSGESEDYMRLNGLKISYAGDNGAYFKAIYELRFLDNSSDGSALRLIGGYRF